MEMVKWFVNLFLQTSDVLLPASRQHPHDLLDPLHPGLSLPSGFRERRRQILSGRSARKKVRDHYRKLVMVLSQASLCKYRSLFRVPEHLVLVIVYNWELDWLLTEIYKIDRDRLRDKFETHYNTIQIIRDTQGWGPTMCHTYFFYFCKHWF